MARATKELAEQIYHGRFNGSLEDFLDKLLAEARLETLEAIENTIGLYAAKYMQSRTPRVEVANEILKQVTALRAAAKKVAP
jgi:hypothetical protein